MRTKDYPIPIALSDATDSASETEDQFWDAICCNDAEADRRFYYAVKTTGIFCRPSCPSRQPLRKNVSFFESREAAEEAGYRPCKRCQPGGETLDVEHARS